MKGVGTSIAPIHAGIKYDLDQLLTKFKETGSVRFRDFACIFRQLEAHLIFYGRQNSAELVEFSERLLQMSIAYLSPIKSNMNELSLEPTDPEYEYTTRIFGVYICYSFYYLQPADYVAQIRITPAQMNSVTQFIQLYLLPERHYDTLACLYKLIDDAAFKIVIFETCYDPVSHKRYDIPDTDELCSDEPDQNMFGLVQSLVDDPLLAQIELIHKKYSQGKDNLSIRMKMQKDPLEICQNLYVEGKKKFEEEQKSSMEAAITDSLLDVKPETSVVPRSSIKEKAYSSKIQHSRNRRYADPEMQENFGILVTGTSNEEERELPPISPPKPKKGRRRNMPSFSAETDEAERTMANLVNELLTENPKKRTRRKSTMNDSQCSASETKEESNLSNLSISSPSKSRKSRKIPARPILDQSFEDSVQSLFAPSITDNINLDELRAD